MRSDLIIHTDGGSRGNPGQAAIGVVIEDKRSEHVKSYGQAIGVKTNNEAEYEAVIFALKKAKQLFGKEQAHTMHVEVRSDSQLVCKQMRAEYKIEEARLFGLFIAVWNLCQDFASVTFVHVPREKNREADRLVNEALDMPTQRSFV